nr:hypothetical protein HmN_000862600 [Hymenolepis microstoma]
MSLCGIEKNLQTPPIGSTGSSSSSSVNMAKWRSAGNLMAETMSIGTYGRSQENLANSTDEIVFPISTNNKAKGKSATKKKTRSLKSNGNKKKQKMSDSAKVEQAVMRTAALPNFLGDTEPFMNQNRGRMNPQSKSLTINFRHANLPDQSQNIRSNVLETTSQLIQRILGSYSHIQHMEYYSLEQFNHSPNGESLP